MLLLNTIKRKILCSIFVECLSFDFNYYLMYVLYNYIMKIHAIYINCNIHTIIYTFHIYDQIDMYNDIQSHAI